MLWLPMVVVALVKVFVIGVAMLVLLGRVVLVLVLWLNPSRVEVMMNEMTVVAVMAVSTRGQLLCGAMVRQVKTELGVGVVMRLVLSAAVMNRFDTELVTAVRTTIGPTSMHGKQTLRTLFRKRTTTVLGAAGCRACGLKSVKVASRFRLVLGPDLITNSIECLVLVIRVAFSGARTLRPTVPPRNRIPLGLMNRDVRGSSLVAIRVPMLPLSVLMTMVTIGLTVSPLRIVTSSFMTLTEKALTSTLKLVGIPFLTIPLRSPRMKVVSGLTTTVFRNTGTLMFITIFTAVTVLTIVLCRLRITCLFAQLTSKGSRQTTTGLMSRVRPLPGSWMFLCLRFYS